MSAIVCETSWHQTELGVGGVSPKISLDLCQLIRHTSQAPGPVAVILGLEEEEGMLVFVFVFELHFAPAFSFPRETNQFCLPFPASPQGSFWSLSKRNQCFCPTMVINSSILDSSAAMILINHQVYQITKIANF